ncbi:MAG: hypoxanthine phosphoribosyltransferase [Deltaproteobacteria bacterium]|nr:hypoxanthine phosphoribosyltransferase [Deltaproteobacteria bacterium]
MFFMRVLYTAEEIATRVVQLGGEITTACKGSNLVVIGILKGCFIFMSDLVRQIELPLEIDFARLASYGKSDSPSGEVKILKDIEIDIENKNVLIVDDITDTGHTLGMFKKHLIARKAKSVKICTLIDKTWRRQAHIRPDFTGFCLEKGFVVGYGLDYGEKYRTLPEIYVLETQDRE